MKQQEWQTTSKNTTTLITATTITRPVPFAVLKQQFKKLFEYQQVNQIYTKDLLSLIHQYEQIEQVVLLTEAQKTAILPYTTTINPDLEMTFEDVLELLKLVCPPLPAPVSSISAPSSDLPNRPRTSAPLNSNKQSTHWKRRHSTVSSSIQDRKEFQQLLNGTTIVNSDLIPDKIAIQEDDDYNMEEVKMKEEEESSIITTSLNNLNIAIINEDEKSDGILSMSSSRSSSISISTSNNNNNNNNNNTPMVVTEEEYSTKQDLTRYYRRSCRLTQKLKSSEKSLASIAHYNEDRIIKLQTLVDDMSSEVTKQKREIQEYKGKEKNSLEQISALESHIDLIQRSETDHKQVYLSIKKLFDEKCEETQKLQDMLRQKESYLKEKEYQLKNFQNEVQLLGKERKRLIDLQADLKLELETSAQAHEQLEEQKTENEKLKEIIDTLKIDLNDALLLNNNLAVITTATNNGIPVSPTTAESLVSSLLIEEPLTEENSKRFIKRKTSSLSIRSMGEESYISPIIKTLEVELIDNLEESERLRSIQDEKEYYKSKATETKEDLDRVKSELDGLKRALDSENRALVNEIANLRQKTANMTITKSMQNSNDNSTVIQNQIQQQSDSAIIILDSIRLDMPEPPIDTTLDVWAHSRLRQPNNGIYNRHDRKKSRIVQDLHEPSSINYTVSTTNTNRRTMSRKDDKVITNTVTFALYTVLIYFFGIVTSAFFRDNGNLEQAIMAATAQSGSQIIPKSKVLEIILYWIEKLLFEPQGLPVS